MTWLRDLMGLPKIVLHAALAITTLFLGYSVAYIQAQRALRDSRLERLWDSDLPDIRSKLAVHDVQLASLDGTQMRLERKIDNIAEDIKKTAQVVTRIEARSRGR